MRAAHWNAMVIRWQKVRCDKKMFNGSFLQSSDLGPRGTCVRR